MAPASAPPFSPTGLLPRGRGLPSSPLRGRRPETSQHVLLRLLLGHLRFFPFLPSLPPLPALPSPLPARPRPSPSPPPVPVPSPPRSPIRTPLGGLTPNPVPFPKGANGPARLACSTECADRLSVRLAGGAGGRGRRVKRCQRSASSSPAAGSKVARAAEARGPVSSDESSEEEMETTGSPCAPGTEAGGSALPAGPAEAAPPGGSDEPSGGRAEAGPSGSGGASPSPPVDAQREARKILDAVPLPGSGLLIACPAEDCQEGFDTWTALKSHAGLKHPGQLALKARCPWCDSRPDAWLWLKHLYISDY